MMKKTKFGPSKAVSSKIARRPNVVSTIYSLFMFLFFLTGIAGAAPTSGDFTKDNDYPVVEERQGGCISLFREETAGDYRILYLFEDGSCLYTHYQYTILEDRRGKIPRNLINEIFQRFQQVNFFRLENRFELDRSADIVYEDIYYTITLIRNGKKKTVTAHELALPMKLKELLRLLLAVIPKIPPGDLSGSFIRASRMELEKPAPGAEVLSNRVVELGVLKKNKPIFNFNGEKRKEYEFLRRAIERPESFVNIETHQSETLSCLVEDDNTDFYVKYRGEIYLIKIYKFGGKNESKGIKQ
jgi:hypothetical protein